MGGVWLFGAALQKQLFDLDPTGFFLKSGVILATMNSQHSLFLSFDWRAQNVYAYFYFYFPSCARGVGGIE